MYGRYTLNSKRPMESQVAEWQELMGKMRCSKGQKGKGAAKGSDSKGYDRAEMAEVLELAAQRMASTMFVLTPS